jgi:hypothetical protein
LRFKKRTLSAVCAAERMSCILLNDDLRAVICDWREEIEEFKGSKEWFCSCSCFTASAIIFKLSEGRYSLCLGEKKGFEIMSLSSVDEDKPRLGVTV